MEKSTNPYSTNPKLPLTPPQPSEQAKKIPAKRTNDSKFTPAEPMQIDPMMESSKSSAATGQTLAKNPPARRGGKKLVIPRLKQPRPTEFRFDVKLVIPPSDDADVVLIAGITKLFG